MSIALLDGATYLSLPREPETWLLKPLIPKGGASILYGDAKVGKSYAALQLALALRSGGEWLGFPAGSGGPVAYIQLDTPRSLWADRLDQLRKAGHQVESLYLADKETLPYPFDICNPDHATVLQTALSGLNPIAVVVDTLREIHSGDENDSTAMRNVTAALVAVTSPAALIVISHARKAHPESGHDLLADQRGSNYIVGRMDSILRFTRKSIHFIGRGIEEGSIRTARTEDGFWSNTDFDLDIQVHNILADSTLPTMVGKAQALSAITGKGEEACRSLLRRASR